MAGQQDEHAWPGLAGLEQTFTVFVFALLAEPAHARDFLRRQRRKGLLMTRKRARGGNNLIRLITCRDVCTISVPPPLEENKTIKDSLAS